MQVCAALYTRSRGHPIQSAQNALKTIAAQLPKESRVAGAGCTGSARRLLGIITKADVVKNEIITHAVAVGHFIPNVSTIIEIGGQDSKIIIMRNSVAVDFAMNTVCAAGTGSFLDHQAARLGIPIEEFGEIALRSKNKVNIAGRCTVFAESDMIHKTQMGAAREDIINGLCDAIARNYLSNVGRGKEIVSPTVFLGGVAANKGVKKAFESALEMEITVPKYHNVMGALGAAIIAREEMIGKETGFLGIEFVGIDFKTRSFECKGCPNLCEVVETLRDNKVIDRHGDRCEKWASATATPVAAVMK